jgi:hypothetical protein
MQFCSPQEGFGAQTQDDHLDCQPFHQERRGMVQQILPFHEDAQHHRWCTTVRRLDLSDSCIAT